MARPRAPSDCHGPADGVTERRKPETGRVAPRALAGREVWAGRSVGPLRNRRRLGPLAFGDPKLAGPLPPGRRGTLAGQRSRPRGPPRRLTAEAAQALRQKRAAGGGRPARVGRHAGRGGGRRGGVQVPKKRGARRKVPRPAPRKQDPVAIQAFNTTFSPRLQALGVPRARASLRPMARPTFRSTCACALSRPTARRLTRSKSVGTSSKTALALGPSPPGKAWKRP